MPRRARACLLGFAGVYVFWTYRIAQWTWQLASWKAVGFSIGSVVSIGCVAAAGILTFVATGDYSEKDARK